jgi:Protein of unknown function (DUF998)
MTENTAIARPVAASRTAAQLSFAAATLFLVLLVALHFIKPGVDPSWRMISEYEIGNHGWIMQLAFISVASSCVALFVAIRRQTPTLGGRIGLGLLLVCATGMTIAAIFITDPTTASQDELTTRGNLHGLGTLLGIPGFTVAATLISRSLARNPRWYEVRRSLFWTAALTWIGLLAFILSVALLLPQNGGDFGPDVLIGWPNRFLMVAYVTWLMVVARRATRVREQRP